MVLYPYLLDCTAILASIYLHRKYNKFAPNKTTNMHIQAMSFQTNKNQLHINISQLNYTPAVSCCVMAKAASSPVSQAPVVVAQLLLLVASPAK